MAPGKRVTRLPAALGRSPSGGRAQSCRHLLGPVRSVLVGTSCRVDRAAAAVATLTLELINLTLWPTRARVRAATVHWLEAIYNRRRRRSAIDMLSPVAYEERYWDRRAAA
jgi:transposase InsO family protein